MKIKILFFVLILWNLLLYSADFEKEAKYWSSNGEIVVCELCPFGCTIRNGSVGRCKVRINHKGKLFSLVYGRVCAKNIDPIEKKPIFHLMPGTTAYSIATAGCNLKCKFCQNWQISQATPDKVTYELMTPEEVVNNALKNNCKSIAYTYSEPTVFYEFMLDTASLAKKRGLKNILITSGYINRKPLEELLPLIDAVKVDLKGFNEDFYIKITEGSFKNVLQTLITIKKKKSIIEIVNLVIPGLNDDQKDVKRMCEWIKVNLGADTPLFFTKFHPDYMLKNISETPLNKLEELSNIAEKTGLKYVYIGNSPGNKKESTYCAKCKNILIKRYGYAILANNIKNGRCSFCNEKIIGIWE